MRRGHLPRSVIINNNNKMKLSKCFFNDFLSILLGECVGKAVGDKMTQDPLNLYIIIMIIVAIR